MTVLLRQGDPGQHRAHLSRPQAQVRDSGVGRLLPADPRVLRLLQGLQRRPGDAGAQVLGDLQLYAETELRPSLERPIGGTRKSAEIRRKALSPIDF